MSFVKGSENTASGDAENSVQYCFTMRSKSARSLSSSSVVTVMCSLTFSAGLYRG